MGENTNGKTKKTPGLGLALLPLAFMFVVLFASVVFFELSQEAKVEITAIMAMVKYFFILIIFFTKYIFL